MTDYRIQDGCIQEAVVLDDGFRRVAGRWKQIADTAIQWRTARDVPGWVGVVLACIQAQQDEIEALQKRLKELESGL